jgi:hypothetical protein
MRQRIQFVQEKGKKVLLLDLSHASAHEVEDTVRALPNYVNDQPFGSVLVLTDFTGAELNVEAVRSLKEAAVFNKPYIKSSVWVGAESLPATFPDEIKSFSRREFPVFKNRKEALEWLARLR